MVLVLLAAAPDIAVSQEALPFPTDWFEWETATGVWGGARTELEDAGITWSLNYTADLLANPVGGIRRETAYASELYGSLAFDFGKLLGIPGLTFYAAGTVQQGRSLSEDAIGNVFGVAEVFAGDTVRLAQLYFEQSFYQDRLHIAVGRLSAGNDFAAARSFGYYVNGAVNGNPTTLLENLPSFTTTPFAQWGARMTIIPADFLYFSAGAYNADPSVQDDDKHGVDFTLNPADGVLMLAELGLLTNQDVSSLWLPGRYVIGGAFDTSDYELLSDPTQTKSGNFGIYAIAEQMLYREGGIGSDQGLTVWATVALSPDQQINELPLGLYGGAYYKGLFDGRDDDVTALALYFGSFSEELPGQSAETVIEINHRFQVSSSSYITPNFQYVFNPDGGGIPDAAVFGFEASVNF